MPRFREIEGLRAWLAWTVVVSHLFVVLRITGHNADTWAHRAGGGAVVVFIMISGFVITGLILDRGESWPRFILRRAFRIFPAYLVALCIGALTTPLVYAALSNSPWGRDMGSYFYAELRGELVSLARWPAAHWLLHLTLLQGLIPNEILPWSGVSIVGPAWSLSLEWQFYLLAPVIVYAMHRSIWSAVAIVVFSIGIAVLFDRRVFGTYETYTTLVGALWIFLIGMVSRLAMPRLQTLDLPVVAITIICIALGATRPSLIPFAIWPPFLAHMTRGERTAIAPVMRTLFQSPLATALGARSYSVYILHLPLMEAWLSVLPIHTLTRAQAFFCLAPLTVVSLLLVSELTYRFVEKPMIRLGARVASLTATSSSRLTPAREPTS